MEIVESGVSNRVNIYRVAWYNILEKIFFSALRDEQKKGKSGGS